MNKTMKQRRLIVCSTEYCHCLTAERTFSHEYILLVPKGEYFDGVVNFPVQVDEFPKNRKSNCQKFPYKRPPINLNVIVDIHSVTKYSEMMLNVFGDLITVDLTTTRDCEECLNDYDYYTIFELESKNPYLAPKRKLEFKRLLQTD